MPEDKKKTKTKPKPGPAKKPKEEVIEGTVVEEPKPEEKVPETKIVKVLPDYDQLMKFSDVFSKAGLFPGIENQYQAAAVIQLGQEIDLNPMTALRTIFVIPSKRGSTLCIKSEALLALAIKKGVHVEVLEKTNKGCKLKFSRKGQKDHIETFIEEDAKRAGLLGKDNWMKHPTNMYLWRCVKNGLQSFDARLSLGLSTVEEMEDEGIVDILKPPSEKEEKPPEPEEEKKPKVSFTKTKDQPVAEPEKEEKPPEPPAEEESEIKEKEKLVEGIKACLKKANVDEKLFKKWLGEELQLARPDRKFVGLKFGNWSFTEGNIDDLKILSGNMEWAIVEGYLKSETFKKEAQKEEPDDDEEKVPF